MIKFDHVSFGYGHTGPAVRDVSFSIEKGEFAAVVGENGAGKSTLSKLVNGLLKPSSGTVKAAGHDTAAVGTSRLARHIGYLFQNPDRQICQNTVYKEIRFGLELVRENEKNIDARVSGIIAEFVFDGDRDPFTLSRGERQRVALASIIAAEPEILILDEPTTGLDYRECMHVMSAVEELNRRGATIVMISHDMEVVRDFAKRILVLSHGKLIADGKPAEIFRDASVMATASILPPQMTELAVRLGDGFEDADTVNGMVTEIRRIKAGRENGGQNAAAGEGWSGV